MMGGSGNVTLQVDLPYLIAPKGRNGKRYWYYRRAGQRIPIGCGPEDPGFAEAYQRIAAMFARTKPTGAGTMAALIAAFYASPEFKKGLRPSTQRVYRHFLEPIREQYGDRSYKTLPRKWITWYRDKLGDQPATANHAVAILHRLFAYAADHDLRKDNPAAGVKKIGGTGENRPWEDYEVEAFRSRWAPETVQRVILELYLNTAQRGSDVVEMTRQRYAKGLISVRQKKTGERLSIPVSAALRAVLDPWLAKHEHVLLVTTPRGRQFSMTYLQRTMRDAMDAAGLPMDCTLHGLRYTAATILRELGLDWETIGDVTGHRTAQMVRKYTRQKRNATAAIKLMDEARGE